MRRVLLGLVFVMFSAALLMATTVIPMSVEELTRRSTHIIRARATESRSEWNADHSIIYTYTRFAVVESWKGTAPQTVIVKQPGGTAGGYSQKVAGVRHFATGEEAVLFLRPSEAADGTLVVTGLMQGNFHLYRAPSGEVTASNGVAGVSALQSGAVAQYQGRRMTVRELQDRVRQAVAQ